MEEPDDYVLSFWTKTFGNDFKNDESYLLSGILFTRGPLLPVLFPGRSDNISLRCM